MTVETATTSWTIPDRHVRVAASRTVLRRIGKVSTLVTLAQRCGEAGAEGGRAAVGRVADVRPAEPALGEAADGDQAPAGRELGEKRRRVVDLSAGGRAVRALGPGMRGDEVPEEDVVGDAELVEDAVNDRRCRLGRPCTR